MTLRHPQPRCVLCGRFCRRAGPRLWVCGKHKPGGYSFRVSPIPQALLKEAK